ncbi:MAG TPA: undecaprenyldiphospho-muramoylpentapeptide beta-N-acetylglucosaminyltransferase [Verrucomicrobiae bacterium]|nr:undecaprenyldiphospho-muramoylpentapeptide beta-N-acetylglucosaminyltransferase [Verrucomicrobiae bacterium]
MRDKRTVPLVAIACGGTGGHLFPGMAVGEELLFRGAEVMLLVSQKDVDQEAVRTVRDMRVVTLPAVGMTGGGKLAFFKGAEASYRECRRVFAERPPRAVLAMGGFTSAPPIMAGRKFQAATFIHESNSIPGRANRLLAHLVDQVFTGFSETAGRLHNPNIHVVGTPVRPQFEPMDPGAARMTLGLLPDKPVLLVMGGSQGASGINERIFQALPLLAKGTPDLQILHLTGPRDLEAAKAAYAKTSLRVVARPFLTEMEYALGAATLAVGRAGASSLAELAAMRLPAILIPYPAAVDNHQWHNAHDYTRAGAARLLEQKDCTAELLAKEVTTLLGDQIAREKMREALAEWHQPQAAAKMAEWMLAYVAALKSPSANPAPASGAMVPPPGMQRQSVNA